MNKLFQKTIIALLAIVWSATSIQAQNVNTDRYIKSLGRCRRHTDKNRKRCPRADSNGRFDVVFLSRLYCRRRYYDDIW